MKSRHYSKVDWWVYLVASLLLFFLVAYPIIGLIFQSTTTPIWLTILYPAIFLVMLAISWPLRYEITKDLLIIRSGLFYWCISLDSIIRVEPSKVLCNAPALSFDRLKIQYRNPQGEISTYVSPKNKEAFLNDLVTASKLLTLKGEMVIRKDDV